MPDLDSGSQARYISWENLSQDLTDGVPKSYRLAQGSDLYLRPYSRDALVLDIGLGSTEEIPKLDQLQDIHCEKISEGGTTFLRMKVGDSELFNDFYHFSTAVADVVADQDLSPLEALGSVMGSHKRLLKAKRELSDEEVIGLFGELWALEQLIDLRGPAMVSSWTGADGDAHDFRFCSSEIEVKTTRSLRREHRISRLDQLQESPGKSLFLLSLQVSGTGKGGGQSLSDQIRICREKIGDGPNLDRFNSELKKVVSPERETDPVVSERLIQFRSRPYIVPVGDDFPRLTSALLAQVLNSNQRSRLSEMKYKLDVSGLGTEIDGKELLDAVSVD